MLRVLEGKAAGVIRGLREMATKRGLTGGKKKAITTVCAYLKATWSGCATMNICAAGYPIASGAVEGACRHLVKDRMERAGMHWTMPGAQGDAGRAQHLRQWPLGGVPGISHRTRDCKTIPASHIGRTTLCYGGIAEERLRPIENSPALPVLEQGAIVLVAVPSGTVELRELPFQSSLRDS